MKCARALRSVEITAEEYADLVQTYRSFTQLLERYDDYEP